MRSSSVFDDFAGLHFENEPGLTELDAIGETHRCVCLNGGMAETL